MRILKNIFFILIFIFLEFFLFKISWELGISSLVLSATIFCIWYVLKKITTIVPHDLVKNPETFFHPKKSKVAKNLIPGIDGGIFENFKKNLGLKPPPNKKNEQVNPNDNSKNIDFLNNFHDNSEKITDKDIFEEELNEKEQIRVTLSENAKKLNEIQENNSDGSNSLNKGLDNFSNSKKGSSSEILGSGEEALKLLSSKQNALRNKTEKSENVDFIERDDDIFEDELIPIPGGVPFPEKNNKSEEHYFLEDDEYLENSITKNQTEYEKKSEAESLLKLATSSCAAGKFDEARVSLKIYLDLLNDLGQEPTADVKKLLTKLDITINNIFPDEINKKNEEKISKNKLNHETLLQELPEQSNYANVMEGLIKSLEKKEAYEEALPLLKDLIEYNKKRGDISYIDRLYDRIEQAYSSLKDDDKLVAAYKEHLSIKKQLEDLDGELNLLDLISYYYANTGDQEASKRFQGESKRLKAIIDEKITYEKNFQEKY